MMRRRLIFPFLALMAGCALPQYGTFTREVDIVGPETLKIPFVFGSPVPAENDDVKIVIASIKPVGIDLFQLFSFVEKKGHLPRRVTVEDVAGTTPELFVDDRNPKFASDPRNPNLTTKVWDWVSPSLVRSGWKPAWLHDPDESVRVYRFTIVTADGRTIVLYQGTPYAFAVKGFILKALDQGAPPKKDQSAEEVHM